MKNLIKSRRGIAIEMAIVMMFIMIALSIVLISICGVQIEHMKEDIEDFNKKIDEYRVLDAKNDIENAFKNNPNLFNEIEDSKVIINKKVLILGSILGEC